MDRAERLFRLHAEIWDRETMHLSSIQQSQQHASYKICRFLALQEPIRFIPLLLDDLQSNRRFWFGLLHELTGEWPVPSEYLGKIDKMIEYWVRWGSEKYPDIKWSEAAA